MNVAALALCLAAAPGLKVGVTLHPYFSWTAKVVAGTPVEVVALLPGEVDADAYQPSVADIARLKALDALVVNGLGHDAFIDAMVKASGNQTLKWIRPNDSAALLPNHRGPGKNPHTFLSLSNAAQQTHAIARALAKLDPAHGPTFEANAVAYAKTLRGLRATAAAALAKAKDKRVITVHDGYGYLMQELGVEVVGVVEPAHGLLPSAKELGEVVKLITDQKVKIVLAEEQFPPAMLKVLTDAGAKAVVVSHVATGPYSGEQFEQDMQANLNRVVAALTAP